MIVTKIEEISRSHSKIYLDDCFAFVLYKGELRLYGVREGEELSERDFIEITQKVLPKRAGLRCMNLLKSRAYTESQLRDKLAQGLYPKESIDAALEYVKSFHYVDDAGYAADYIVNQQEKKSRRIIEMDLVRKGIPRETIAEAFAACEELGEGPDERALAQQWLKKKHYDTENADYKERQKMAAFLYRKGITGEIIRSLLSED